MINYDINDSLKDIQELQKTLLMLQSFKIQTDQHKTINNWKQLLEIKYHNLFITSVKNLEKVFEKVDIL